MIADKTIIYDGQTYKPGDTVHDLGTFVCTSSEDNRRSYEGLSADVSKLPKYDTLGTGSSALCLDTGDFYKYEATTKTWYKLQYVGGY